MATVVSCNLAKDGRSARIDEKGVRRYTLKFIIRTDDVSIAMLEALLSTGNVPGFFAYYRTEREFDYYATAREWDIQQTDDPRVWDVVVQYSSEFSPARDAQNVARDAGNLSPSDGTSPSAGGSTPSGVGNQDQNDPIGRKPDVSWGVAVFQKAIMHTPAGTAIVASNGEPFDPPLEVDDFRVVYRVSRNERFFNPGTAFQYINKCNADNFKGAAPGQAKVINISGDEQWERNVSYARVTYEIHFRVDTTFGWDARVLDMGTYKVVGGVKKPILHNGVPVSNPVPLDGAGGELTQNDIDAGNFHYRTFRTYERVKFAKLKL